MKSKNFPMNVFNRIVLKKKNITQQRRYVGIFSNFVENIKKGFETKEMKDSLDKLNKQKNDNLKLIQNISERTILTITPLAKATIQTSHVLKQKIGNVLNKIFTNSFFQKSKKVTTTAATIFADVSKKTTQIIDKTKTYKKVRKGVYFLKEELVDDSVLSSAKYHPYRSPSTELKKRIKETSESLQYNPIKKNLDAEEVVLHKTSKWEIEWQNFKENNTILQKAYEWKMVYDESDNIFIRGFRNVQDKYLEAKESLIGDDTMLQVFNRIKQLDPTFEKEDFIETAHSEYIPLLLESYYNKDVGLLRSWCSDRIYEQLEEIYKHQQENGIKEICEIKEISYVDIFDATMMEQGPVLNLIARVQQVSTTINKEGIILQGNSEIVEEALYYVAFYKEEGIYPTTWKIRDFSIHHRRPMAL